MSAGVSTPSDNSMDPEELREKLYAQLKNTGVVNVLKTQLRSQLLGQLQHRYDVGLHKGRQKKQDSATKALNCAIAEYLEFAGHRYSLSIFQPESGAPCEAFSREEMLTLLGISSDSPTWGLLNEAMEAQKGNEGPCFLPAVFQILKHFGGPSGKNGAGKNSSSTQTKESGSAVALLNNQLQQVEYAYAHRLDSSFQTKQLEDRMSQYKRECDERVAREVAAQVENLRRADGANSRMSDSNCNWRKQLEEQREDLDRIHLARSRELHERENRVMEQLNQQRVEMERVSFEHLKKMANEEQTLQWKKEEFERSCQSRKDHVESLEMELRERERKLKRKELELDESRDAIEMKIRKELNDEMADERKKLLDQKMALESLQDRIERDSEEKIRSSLEKMKRTEFKLEECQNVIQRHQLNEENLHRRLNQQKDALSRSTEILAKRQEKNLSSLDRQLECSFDSGAGSLGVVGLQRVLQESNRHESEVRKLMSKIRGLSKQKQQLEGELQHFDEQIQQLKEKSLEQGALLDEAISERLEALDHAEELRSKLGGAERRCCELKRKLERSTMEIATLRANAQFIGTTYGGVHWSNQNQNMHPGIHAHQNFTKHSSPAPANSLLPRKEPSTSCSAPKLQSISARLLEKSSCLDVSTPAAEFSWQASQLEREEEALKKKLKDFRRKVEMGRRNTERELNGIARRVERSRNRERSKRDAIDDSTESELSTDFDENDSFSSVSDKPYRPLKSKSKHKLMSKDGKPRRGAPLKFEAPQSLNTCDRVQRYAESETPSGGMLGKHGGTPSPILLDVSPAVKCSKPGQKTNLATSSGGDPDPGQNSEEKVQYMKTMPGGLNEVMSEIPMDTCGQTLRKDREAFDNGDAVGIPSILSTESSLNLITENNARTPPDTIPEKCEPQVEFLATRKLGSARDVHPEVNVDAGDSTGAGLLPECVDQSEAALGINERSRSSENCSEAKDSQSGESDEVGELCKLNQHSQAPPHLHLEKDGPKPHSVQTSSPPEKEPQAHAGAERTSGEGITRNELGVCTEDNHGGQSEISDEKGEQSKNVLLEVDQSDEDGLLVEVIEAPEEERSIEVDEDDGDASSETSFSSLPPELDSVGEMSTGFSDGQEGRLSWGGEF